MLSFIKNILHVQHTKVHADVLWRQKNSSCTCNYMKCLTKQGSCKGTVALIAINLLQGQPHRCPQAFRMISLRCLELRQQSLAYLPYHLEGPNNGEKSNGYILQLQLAIVILVQKGTCYSASCKTAKEHQRRFLECLLFRDQSDAR